MSLLILQQNLLRFMNTFKSIRCSTTFLVLSLSYGWCKRYDYMDFNNVRMYNSTLYQSTIKLIENRSIN